MSLIELEKMEQLFANTEKTFNSLFRAFQKGVLSRKKREYKAQLDKMDRNPKRRMNRSFNRKFKK